MTENPSASELHAATPYIQERFRKFGDGCTNDVDCCAYLDRRAASPDPAGHVTNAANARRKARRIKAMNAPLKALDSSAAGSAGTGSAALVEAMRRLGRDARAAARTLALASAA